VSNITNQLSVEVSSLNTPMQPIFDYIVIGAGSAGSVVANRLTEDLNTKVLLLEAGGPDTKPEIQVPSVWPTLLGSEVDWGYFTLREPYLNNRKIFSSRGKVLGGSSSINGMIYIRGSERDYNSWQALGNQGWSYQDVLPYFKKSENQQRGVSLFHGIDGPLNITDPLSPARVSQRFVEAAQAQGYEQNPDFNGLQQKGAGLYQVTVKDGKRESTAVAFLRPIKDRPNLTIQTGALVTRLLFERKRTVGVAYVQNATEYQVRVNSEVILSAGAFDSPKLLMLSGIGPAEHLRALGIPVVVDLPGVGQNLQDHPLAVVGYQSTQDQPPAPSSNGGEAGLFLHTNNNLDAAPNLQLTLVPILYVDPAYARSGPGFTITSYMTHPESRGSVKLRSSSPSDPPLIRVNYLQKESDMQLMVEGVKISRQIVHSDAFNEFRGEEIAPGGSVHSDKAIEDYIRQTCGTAWHPVGTCKMGIDQMAVVDPQLKVRGIEGLRVVDASIMPTIITGNTNAAAIMIGEKAADLIKVGTKLR
jgi:choline dehydrogenase